MIILVVSSRCPDCDEQMSYTGNGVTQVCRWCAVYGPPDSTDDFE